MKSELQTAIEVYKEMSVEALHRLRGSFEWELGRFLPLAKRYRDEYCIARISVLNSLIQEKILNERRT